MLIAGNWKMNMTRPEAVRLATEVLSKYSPTDSVRAAVCPTAVCLESVGAVISGSGIGLGAQNMHAADSGAYTGEVSAAMLKSVGCDYVILGHSERRQYFGETDAGVNGKVHQALSNGLTPIVCVGEQLHEREAKRAEEVVRNQTEGALAGIGLSDPTTLVVAYEPVWAIGTGVTATPEQAQEMHAFIRSLLVSLLGSVGTSVDILYGGSMKPGNAAELLSQEDVNGGLIGGASLKADQFLAIVEAAQFA